MKTNTTKRSHKVNAARFMRAKYNHERPEGAPRMGYRQVYDALFERHRLPTRAWWRKVEDAVVDLFVPERKRWRWIHTN